ncbi:MAG: GNAT family N-acetyltransferase [Candidatus Bathyarchaeota archaeon]|nr:GNAT family N-acetyltransferase [Candidatus Bathyarchaeota archaeon]
MTQDVKHAMAYPVEWETVFTAKNGRILHFRPEKSSDTEMLWAMFSTLSEATVSNLIPPFTRERIEGWTSNIDYDDVLAIVAVTEEENAQRIVGSASLKFQPQGVFKHKAELGLTVHDDYQNLGIGAALLKHLLNIARKKKLTKIFLTVNTMNAKAIHLYQKAGFEIEGILRKEMLLKGKFLDEYRMALFL